MRDANVGNRGNGRFGLRMTVLACAAACVAGANAIEIDTGNPDLTFRVDTLVRYNLGVRAEHTRLWDPAAGLVGPIEGRVEYVESLGRETLIGVSAAEDARFVIEADGRVRFEPGEPVSFGLRKGYLYLFDASDERSLGRV